MAASKAEVRVEVNQAAFRAYCGDPNSGVYRHLMTLGEAVKQEAINSLSAAGSGGWTVRGFLAPLINKRVEYRDEMPVVRVGADNVKTPAHPITGNPILSFKWPNAPAGLTPGPDGMFHFAYVNHPGSNFRRYLLEKLSEALRVVQEIHA